MSPRTPTLPPTEPVMWRKLLARAHPDTGGDHELFIWTGTLRDMVCGREGSARNPSRPWGNPMPEDGVARVSFAPDCDFAALTGRALQYDVGDYGQVLALLRDCWPLERFAREQERGASYKRLAAIGHVWGMSKAERGRWYRVAEAIPLSDRHAGHILDRSKARAA